MTATPEYIFEVDWADDGTWTDITSDVKSIILDRGRDTKTNRANAAVLDLMVNNSDHKYTPTNSASALYPDVVPGKSIRSYLIYPYDALDDAGTDDLSGRTLPNDSGFSWAGDASSFEFDTNVVKANTTGELITYVDFGLSYAWVGVKMKRLTDGSGGGLILHWLNDSNYTLIDHTTTDIRIRHKAAGVFSTEASAAIPSGVAVGDWFLLTAQISRSEHNVYVNNEIVLFDIGGGLVSDALGEHGIGGDAVTADHRWTQFGGWKPLFEGRVDLVQPRPESDRQYAYIRAYDDMERLRQHQVFRLVPESAVTSGAGANAGEIIETILGAANVSDGKMALDTGVVNLTVTAANVKVLDRDALTELYQVADDEVGFAWIDGAGVYRFEQSDHRELNPHDTSLATWVDAKDGSEDTVYFVEPFEWEDGKDRVENEVYYQFYPVTRSAVEVVWELNPSGADAAKPEFEQSSPVGVEAVPMVFLAVGDGDQIAEPLIPLHITDYTINAEQDGNGANQSVSLANAVGTVSINTTTFTLDDTGRDFGDTAVADGITFTLKTQKVFLIDAAGVAAVAFLGNDDPDGDGTRVSLLTRAYDDPDAEPGYASAESGFSAATITSYVVRTAIAYFQDDIDGNFKQIVVSESSEFIANGSTGESFLTFLRLRALRGVYDYKTAARAEDSTSQTANGRRRILHEAKHIDTYAVALDRARERLAQRKDAKAVLEVNMGNGNRGCLMNIVHREISDRVTVQYTDMDIDGDFFVERYKLQINDGGKNVRMTWTVTAA